MSTIFQLYLAVLLHFYVVTGLNNTSYSNCDSDGSCIIIPYNHVFNITSLAYTNTSPSNSSKQMVQQLPSTTLNHELQSVSDLIEAETTSEFTVSSGLSDSYQEEVIDNEREALRVNESNLDGSNNLLSENSSELLDPSNSKNITLDDCHFLSFEEWKKLKEVESKASPQAKKYVNDSYSNIQMSSNNSDVKSTNSTSGIVNPEVPKVETEEDQGKVYKVRFNYASSDCAATVVKTNSQAKGAAALLLENKDSYLLNKCSLQNKFVIIELCQDILIDSIVIGNYEFFSSMFRNIRVSASDRFPSTTWTTLGEFEADNIRDIQTFQIDNPIIWARYVKIEILTHYGNEYYCPMSIVRVHGKTMMEEFKEDEQSKAVEENELINTDINDTEIENALADECRVILPHLRLHEFLKDFNSTDSDYCTIPDVEATQSIETKSIQESVFKNIIKRLSLLESNATLSLLYIEEQSKLLSSAFTNLEKRQTHNFETLMKSFNTSMNNQIRNFRNSYANLHHEYTKLFNSQETQYGQILQDSTKKLSDLTKELRFQKRISIFNCIVIICLLVYVILTRGVYIDNDESYIDNYYQRSPKLLKPSKQRYKKKQFPRKSR